MTPYYTDAAVTLYCGDALEILPLLAIRADAIITDPPYNGTHLAWDVWPTDWPALVATITPQLWCFGSFRMFWERRQQFSMWKLAQDTVWEKHNGSNSSADRFRRVHELAVHFYLGEWSELYKQPQFTQDAVARRVHRRKRPTQWGDLDEASYESEDGGPRHMTSVQYVRGCHGYAVNETQKPEGIVEPLLKFSVPPGGLVLDPFAGSGTTLAVAKRENRRAIGIELREEQCKQIVQRLAQGTLNFDQGAT